MYQKESKQSARTLSLKQRKENQSNLQEEILFLRPKKLCIKSKCRQNSAFKAKETVYQKKSKQSARRNSTFKTKETVYQKESKKSARKDPVFKTKERQSKQFARINPIFKTKEKVYQKESKHSSRENPVLRIKKLCIRRNQRREREKIRLLKHRKKYARTHPKEGQGQIRMFLNARELRSNK